MLLFFMFSGFVGIYPAPEFYDYDIVTLRISYQTVACVERKEAMFKGLVGFFDRYGLAVLGVCLLVSVSLLAVSALGMDIEDGVPNLASRLGSILLPLVVVGLGLSLLGVVVAGAPSTLEVVGGYLFVLVSLHFAVSGLRVLDTMTFPGFPLFDVALALGLLAFLVLLWRAKRSLNAGQ